MAHKSTISPLGIFHLIILNEDTDSWEDITTWQSDSARYLLVEQVVDNVTNQPNIIWYRAYL